MRKIKLGLPALLPILVGLVFLPGLSAPNCEIAISEGSDVVNMCSSSTVPSDLNTGRGDDTITVDETVTVRGASVAIDTGPGSDRLDNYGTITSNGDAVNLRTGAQDVLNNYGTIHAAYDAVWCSPWAGQHCTINNYGTITADNEAIDINSMDGTIVLTNSGTIRSTWEEALHLKGGATFELTNTGIIEAYKNAIETNGGAIMLTNAGLIFSARETSLNFSTGVEIVNNSGRIRADYAPAISMSGGDDVVINTGTISATTDSAADSAVELGGGDDTLITSGDILVSGVHRYAVEGGSGQDMVIIQGGTINDIIDGGDHRDTLVFEFTGTDEEYDLFVRVLRTQDPAKGSMVWHGQKYTWRNFEKLNVVFHPPLTMTGGGADQ